MNSESPFNSTTTFYAPLGKRLLAFILDLIILVIPSSIAGHIIPIVGGIIVLFLYGPILESSEIKATLGKHLVGIQVVDMMGRKISLRMAVLRNVLKFVSSVLLFIGFFFAIFTRKKQTLHDLLSDTLVVYGRSDYPIADAWLKGVKDLFQFDSFPSQESSQTLDQLERLQALRNQGALTEEEFQEQKRKILSE
jgi:uncharacterized RDD family membrane protein YckC